MRSYTDRMIEAVKDTLHGMEPELAAIVYGLPYWKPEPTEEQRRGMAIYDSLSEEEKQDIIEVNGRRYIRRMYEEVH